MTTSIRVLSQHITRPTLRKEIIFVIFLKIIGLMVLWHFFFSHPTDHTLKREELVQHYLVS